VREETGVEIVRSGDPGGGISRGANNEKFKYVGVKGRDPQGD